MDLGARRRYRPVEFCQVHNVMHQVLKYAQRSGQVANNVAAEVEHKTDLLRKTNGCSTP